MIAKAAIAFFLVTQIASVGCAVITFGSLFFFFLQSLEWKVNFAWQIIFPLALAVCCQIIIGLIIFNDAQKRLWDNEIKRDLWSSLGRTEYFPYQWALFTVPTLSAAYFFMIMNFDMRKNWWKEQQKNSGFFRFITQPVLLNLFSKAGRIFIVALLAAASLFALEGMADSVSPSLLSFKIFGASIVVFPAIVQLFHFLTLSHFLSKEWTDYSFELYYKNYPIGRWPKHEWLDAVGYYNKVMKNEN